MIAAIRSALAYLERARSWLTLLAVAGAAAWCWIQYASVTRDRDQLLGLAGQICAAAGSEIAPPDNSPRGEACRRAVTDLVVFRADSLRATAELLAQAEQLRAGKARADAALARNQAAASAAAQSSMEKADASVTDDHVDGSWFAALNDLGGLR